MRLNLGLNESSQNKEAAAVNKSILNIIKLIKEQSIRTMQAEKKAKTFRDKKMNQIKRTID